jgi:hypothetical protein
VQRRARRREQLAAVALNVLVFAYHAQVAVLTAALIHRQRL